MSCAGMRGSPSTPTSIDQWLVRPAPAMQSRIKRGFRAFGVERGDDRDS